MLLNDVTKFTGICMWSNVNLEKRTALLPDTKNGTVRVVPLSLVALDVLNRLPREDNIKVLPN